MQLPLLSKSLMFKIQQLSVVPVLICITLIGVGYAFLHTQESRAVEHQRSLLAANWLAALTKTAIARDDVQHITHVFGDLLEIPYIRGVYLITPEGDVSVQLGQRASRDIHTHLANAPSRWSVGGNHYYSVPVTEQSAAASRHLGWVVFSVNRGAQNILQYQTIIVTLFAILVASCSLILLAWRLTRNMEMSLQGSQRTLQDFTRYKFDSRAPVRGCIELQSLAQSVNELGSSLQQAQKNVRKQVEQATSDLQETLETVEIQSIELDIARRNAVAANRAKSEFLANTTHEIRTPINGILGFTNLLLKSPLTTQQREYLRTIAHSSQGLLTIINDILDFSRLEEDELSLDRAPFTLRQVIEEALQILAPSASEKQLYLIATSEPDVPQHLLGDALRLKQVLINLVSNAIKFSDTGDIVVRSCLVEETQKCATIRISVEDSGIGIDPQLTESLFEPFKQADASDSRLRGGTGLGLAIAKGLVEKMGGSIKIDSRLEHGTTVCFTLPLPKQQTLIQSRQDDLRGKKGLIYVENPRIAQQLAEYLTQWGVERQLFDSVIELESHCCLQSTAHAECYGAEQNQPDFIFIIANPHTLTSAALRQMHQSSPLPVLVATLPDSPLAYDESLHKTDINLLFLPLSQDHLYQVLCDTLIPSATPATTVTVPQYPAATVLVVDDNAANLQLTSTLLASLGLNVRTANSGAEALKLMDVYPVDLVFMDVQMPRMDGIETTQHIRAREHMNQKVPIIALTAHNVNELKTKILKAGMNDSVSKPVSEEQLIHILKRWLSLSPIATSSRVENVDVAPHLAELITGTHIPQSSVMNLQEALRLSNGNKALARDMLSKLVQDLPSDAELIVKLYKEQRWSELQERIHHLYGGCCYCGVPELRQAAAELDNLLLGGHTPPHRELNRLLKAIQRLREWVDSHDLDIIFDTGTV